MRNSRMRRIVGLRCCCRFDLHPCLLDEEDLIAVTIRASSGAVVKCMIREVARTANNVMRQMPSYACHFLD